MPPHAQVGEAYRALIATGRAQLAQGLAADQAAGRVRADIAAPALAELMTALALGVVAMLELELPLDARAAGETALALLRA